MVYQYDLGAQQDFDNMTREAGREVMVYPREESLDYEGYEGDGNNIEGNPMSAKPDAGVKEVVFLQELDTQHEVVKSGMFKVGDVKFTFLSSSTVEEEGYVVTNGKTYKVLELTKYEGMSNNIITDIRAFGKKLPNR